MDSNPLGSPHASCRGVHRRRQSWMAVAIGLLVVAGAPARAACPTPENTASAETRARHQTVLRQIEAAIRTDYVFVELRDPLIDHLRAAEQACRYEGADDVRFAELVTEDLQSVSHDGHLYLTHDPALYAAMSAPPASDAGIEAFRRDEATRINHGLTEMRIISENIRYLKISAFKWVPDGTTARAYDAAAAFLAGGDAIIIDLRGNGGGESDAADYFLNHIVTLGRLAERPRPFFILIDGRVGSAAEAVTYDAKLRGAAVIVGANSYGAANNNRRIPIAPGFVLSISYNRPIHPLSGTNWEGVGVEPDVRIDPALALEAAEQSALAELDARLPAASPLKERYAWRHTRLQAILHPAVVNSAGLVPLQGRYGAIELRYSDGALRLYRADRPRWPQGRALSPLTADGIFALDGTDDLRFRITPGRLEILRPGAPPEVFPAGQ